MAGGRAVEQLLGWRERRHAGLAKLLQLVGRQLGERQGLRQVELPPLGLERVLVEAIDVLQEPCRAREASSVRTAVHGRLASRSRVPPVVGGHEARYRLLTLERELRLGELGE